MLYLRSRCCPRYALGLPVNDESFHHCLQDLRCTSARARSPNGPVLECPWSSTRNHCCVVYFWAVNYERPMRYVFLAASHGVVSRSAKWGGPYLGGSSWNRPQRPNPGHLRDCWGCLGRFLGRLGHRTTAIVSTRGVGKSLEFRPGAPRDFFQVDRNARE